MMDNDVRKISLIGIILSGALICAGCATIYAMGQDAESINTIEVASEENSKEVDTGTEHGLTESLEAAVNTWLEENTSVSVSSAVPNESRVVEGSEEVEVAIEEIAEDSEEDVAADQVKVTVSEENSENVLVNTDNEKESVVTEKESESVNKVASKASSGSSGSTTGSGSSTSSNKKETASKTSSVSSNSNSGSKSTASSEKEETSTSMETESSESDSVSEESESSSSNSTVFTAENPGIVAWDPEWAKKSASESKGAPTDEDTIITTGYVVSVEEEEYVGRLYITSLDVSVALYNTVSQSVCDEEDSACFYTHGTGYLIGDHMYQGFSAIKKAVVGETILYIEAADGVYYRYICTAIDTNSTNMGSWLKDSEGNNIGNHLDGGLVLYTCNQMYGSSVTTVIFQPY